MDSDVETASIDSREAVIVEEEEGIDEGQEISFSTEVAQGIRRQWSGKVVQQPMGKAFVIDVDASDWHSGSKEAFIRVLECAEECLGCAFVYVTAARDQTDLPLLMKTFMYLGFQAVAPKAAPRCVDMATKVCMAIEL